MSAERVTCTALTVEGVPCKQYMNLSPTGLCLFHDPERAAEAADAQSRGGKGKRKPDVRTVAPEDLPGRPPETLEEVARWFSWLTVQLATGVLDYRIGRELAHALTGYRTALEKHELSRKADAIKAKLEDLKGKPKRSES